MHIHICNVLLKHTFSLCKERPGNPNPSDLCSPEFVFASWNFIAALGPVFIEACSSFIYPDQCSLSNSILFLKNHVLTGKWAAWKMLCWNLNKLYEKSITVQMARKMCFSYRAKCASIKFFFFRFCFGSISRSCDGMTRSFGVLCFL